MRHLLLRSLGTSKKEQALSEKPYDFPIFPLTADGKLVGTLSLKTGLKTRWSCGLVKALKSLFKEPMRTRKRPY